MGPTCRQLGGGYYRTVEELDISGLVCTGKKLHDTLINPENQGAQLCHPHIIKVPRTCFLSNITLSTEVSIFQNVTRSLVEYHRSLNMFSFGHLSLFVVIQVFLQNLLKPTYQDPRTKQLKARSELERRGKYIDILHQKFSQHHPLVALIKGHLFRSQLDKYLTEMETEVQQIPRLRSNSGKIIVSCSQLRDLGVGRGTGEETESLQVYNKTLQVWELLIRGKL